MNKAIALFSKIAIGLMCLNLVIIGINSRNTQNNNETLILALIIIGLVSIGNYILFKYHNGKGDIILIYLLSLSLIYHRTLVSSYLVGWDVNHEMYIAFHTLKEGYWDINFPYPVNSMISISIFLPVLSIVSNTNLIALWKFVIPLTYALLPVCIYILYIKYYRLDARTTFFSIFLIMSFFAFFTEVTALVRQQFAEIVLILFFIIILHSTKSLKKNSILYLLLISMVLTHYTVTYIFIMASAIILSIRQVVKNKDAIKQYNWKIIVLALVLPYTWYTLTSEGKNLQNIQYIGKRMFLSFIQEFSSEYTKDPTISVALSITNNSSLPRMIFRFLNYLLILFLIIGISLYIVSLIKNRSKDALVSKHILSISWFALLLIFIITPVLSTINMTRIYHIASIFYSPTIIEGGTFTLQKAFNRRKITHIALSVIILGYFLFNTGVIYEIVHDPPSSVSLDPNFDYPYLTDSDVSGAFWLYTKHAQDSMIFTDQYRRVILAGIINPEKAAVFCRPLNSCMESHVNYLFFSKIVVSNEAYTIYNKVYSKSIVKFEPSTLSRNGTLIYSANMSKIFYHVRK